MTERVSGICAFVVRTDGLLVIIGLAFGYLVTIIGMTAMPIWWACLMISVPAVSIAAVMFAAKVKEIKGANLEKTD